MAIGLGIGFSSTEVLVNPMKSVLAFALLFLGGVIMGGANLRYRPEDFHKRTGYWGITFVIIGVLALLVEALLKTEYNINFPNLAPYSILVCAFGSMLIGASSFRFKK